MIVGRCLSFVVHLVDGRTGRTACGKKAKVTWTAVLSEVDCEICIVRTAGVHHSTGLFTRP